MTILQTVTRSSCGCNGHDVAKKLITIDAALVLIADRTAAGDGTENLPLDPALEDSTGIRSLDDGEGQARKHGLQGWRQWRNAVALDMAISDIRAVEFTRRRDGDRPVLPERLGQITEGKMIGTVTADGAYDTLGSTGRLV